LISINFDINKFRYDIKKVRSGFHSWTRLFRVSFLNRKKFVQEWNPEQLFSFRVSFLNWVQECIPERTFFDIISKFIDIKIYWYQNRNLLISKSRKMLQYSQQFSPKVISASFYKAIWCRPLIFSKIWLILKQVEFLQNSQ